MLAAAGRISAGWRQLRPGLLLSSSHGILEESTKRRDPARLSLSPGPLHPSPAWLWCKGIWVTLLCLDDFCGSLCQYQEGPTSAVELVGRQQQGASTKAGLASLWDLRYFSRCCCLALPHLKPEKQPTCCSSSPLKWWRADGEAPCLGQCTLSHLRQFCAYQLGLCDRV